MAVDMNELLALPPEERIKRSGAAFRRRVALPDTELSLETLISVAQRRIPPE